LRILVNYHTLSQFSADEIKKKQQRSQNGKTSSGNNANNKKDTTPRDDLFDPDNLEINDESYNIINVMVRSEEVILYRKLEINWAHFNLERT